MPHLVFPRSKQWKLAEQETELEAAGLDSSILSVFTEPQDTEELHALFPSEPPYLDPTSDDYLDQLVAALQLDTDLYKYFSANVLQKFKKLVKEYTHVFYFPGSPLNTITSFEYRIETADAFPVYKLPYRKSSSELGALWTDYIVC